MSTQFMFVILMRGNVQREEGNLELYSFIVTEEHIRMILNTYSIVPN